MRKLLWVGLITLAACGTEQPQVPAVYFKMFYGGSYDMQPFNDAWTAARQDPSVGLAYTFPLVTTDIDSGSELRLVAGRSGNEPSGPSTTADDVIIAGERVLATTTVGGAGELAFAKLSVATGTWTSGTNSLPAELLCGTTVIAARAYTPGHKAVPAFKFLASTFMVAVSSACP
jgi:hypothetical protein